MQFRINNLIQFWIRKFGLKKKRKEREEAQQSVFGGAARRRTGGGGGGDGRGTDPRVDGEGGEGGQQDGEQRYMKAKLALHRLNSPETPRGVSWK